jgi:16S rRNA (cytosine967-C5)-methyltransferase
LARTPWAPGAPALADAARAIASVVDEGRSTDIALAPFEATSQRAAIRAIALGTLRWYLRLAPAVDRLLSRPKGVAPRVHALLVATAHQIEYSRNAPEVSVHAAVDAARILKEERATGLVNAVLRRFVRERSSLLGKVDREVPGRTAHPAWLVKRLTEAWPQQVGALLDANNAHPPMVLRVDLSRCTREEYLADLHAAGIAAQPISWAPAAVRLEQPVALAQLPRFQGGAGPSMDGLPVVSVQDAGAQLAARLLDARPGTRVLDACAAPGGKTGHLLEHTPELAELVAADIDAQRMERIKENLARLKRVATPVVADVRRPESFWDGKPFDRILLDAPCSSTGVIRRHPDIKLLRRPDDAARFAKLQLEILQACYRMLAPGGRLLYCTCSVLPEENEAVLQHFVRDETSAQAVPTAAELVPGAVSVGFGLQLLPGAEAGSDGFYYACVEKTTI